MFTLEFRHHGRDFVYSSSALLRFLFWRAHDHLKLTAHVCQLVLLLLLVRILTDAFHHHFQVCLVHGEHIAGLFSVVEVYYVAGVCDKTWHFGAYYYIGQHINQVICTHLTIPIQIKDVLDDADGPPQLIQLGLRGLELLDLLDLVDYATPGRVAQLLLREAKLGRIGLFDHLYFPLEVFFSRAQVSLLLKVLLQDNSVHMEHYVL